MSSNQSFLNSLHSIICYHVEGAVENPVTNEEYLRTHNMEVLCGPVSLSSCLDLTEQAGTVTFSSVKLFRMRGRTLLVHMKALSDPAAVSKGFSYLFSLT